MRTLKRVQIRDTATVVKLHGTGAVKRRIMDMGITEEAWVFVHRIALLGDPIEMKVRDYELSLRKADAELIKVD